MLVLLWWPINDGFVFFFLSLLILCFFFFCLIVVPTAIVMVVVGESKEREGDKEKMQARKEVAETEEA